MKLINGKIPEDKKFEPQKEGWVKLKEPNLVVTQITSLPIGILLFYILHNLTSLITDYGGLKEFTLRFDSKTILIAVLIMIPVHELMHALLYPQGILSDKTTIGFLPQMLAFFAYYEGEMPRNTYLLSCISPLILLSIFPILLMPFVGYSMFWIDLCTLNAATTCVDIFGGLLIMYQVPKTALVKSNGSKTYWKINSSLA